MEQQVRYKYRKMELEQFASFEENIDKSIEEVQFQTETQFSFDKEEHVLCCTITTNMTQKGNPLLKCELRSYFDIDPKSLDGLRKDGKIIFFPGILVQFASLGYGTVRGIMYAKTIGTQLADFILPPIYFGTLIDKSFTVED